MRKTHDFVSKCLHILDLLNNFILIFTNWIVLIDGLC